MSDVFSVPALLIMFREALEAAIIVSVLLQLLTKLKLPELKKWVWFGAIAGVGASVILGIVFVLIFYIANTKLLSGTAQLIFKGCICWVASFLITIVAFAMLKFYNLERKWKQKLQDAVYRDKQVKSYKWSMFFLAGSATFREGIESVLFLTGVSAGSSVKAVIIPGIVGIALGAICGLIIYYTGHSIRSLKWFFILSAGLLLLISAGMVVNGTMFFQEARLFGIMWPVEYRPWSNQIVWDCTACCNPNTNQGWALLRALFGWQAQATNLQLLYYCLYLALTLCLLAYKYYHGSITDREEATIADAKSFARHQLEAAEDGTADVVVMGDRNSSDEKLSSRSADGSDKLSQDSVSDGPTKNT